MKRYGLRTKKMVTWIAPWKAGSDWPFKPPPPTKGKKPAGSRGRGRKKGGAPIGGAAAKIAARKRHEEALRAHCAEEGCIDKVAVGADGTFQRFCSKHNNR